MMECWLTIGIAEICADRNLMFIFTKIEAIHPAVQVGRQPDRLADEIIFEIFKIHY